MNAAQMQLEVAFLVRRLPPYSANIHKWIVKRPKLYWRDTGLLHALLNVRDRDTLLNRSWVGTSWEGFAIEQILAALHYTNRPFDAYYLRTSGSGKPICSSRRRQSYGYWRSNSRRARAPTI